MQFWDRDSEVGAERQFKEINAKMGLDIHKYL